MTGSLARIRVVPWFVYVPGVAWIEHGHVYDEGCSFEFNLAPKDPKDGWLIFNADYAAVRYLGMASPELDPHGIEEWSFWGYMRYAVGQGWRSFLRLIGWPTRGSVARCSAREHAAPLAQGRRIADAACIARGSRQVAAAGGISVETASRDRSAGACAVDRELAAARPDARCSIRFGHRSSGRAGRVVMLSCCSRRCGSRCSAALACTAAAVIVQLRLGKHMVTSQLPMRAVPRRLRKLVDAPVVVFGHTHDPRWQPIRGGGVYVNCGTWLPATRPGLRRSFTHVLIQPRPGGKPIVELRQWRQGASQPFDDRADLGAGVTNPRIPRVAD